MVSAARISGRKAQVRVRGGLQYSAPGLQIVLGGALAEAVGGEARGAVGEHAQNRLGHIGGDARPVEVEQLARLILIGDDRRLEPLPGRLVGRLRRGGGERFLESFVRQRVRDQGLRLLR